MQHRLFMGALTSMLKCVTRILIMLSPLSVQAVEVHPYIVNGQYANVTTFPSIVSLFIDRIDYDGLYSVGSYCGGTLLDSQHVLTAAHCVNNDIGVQLFTVAVPKLQLESDFPFNTLERAQVSEIYYPNNYVHANVMNDIAILKLVTPMKTVSAADYVQLPAKGDAASYRNTAEVFYAVGHGNTAAGIDNDPYLASTQLEYVSAATCSQEYKRNSSGNLCMGWPKPAANGLDQSTCNGDSGGPLYWYTGGQYKQVGITSFGPGPSLSNVGCGDPKVKANSVFTDVLEHQAWVTSVLHGHQTPRVLVTESARRAYLNGSNVPSKPDVNTGKTPDGGDVLDSNTSGAGGVGFISLLFYVGMLFNRQLTS
ncbi:trypsin-like serine protease [Vibrio ostreicida]|uniref:Trypsin-like serine protease n=1 Tax=Vibrio ostreicida TaxID=526588 RepID=A0ABT8C0B0_9VIBR|nr:trypsin-like serine protease [Vibrio ostreicida]MDN3612399.1 trypsin-like serine protease [Vibrio ostreicida]